MFSKYQKAYLAGFLDGDGSIYVRLKPNSTYRYGFQIAPYVVFFQSHKEQEKFEKICDLIQLGYLRIRKDGIIEYIIGKRESIIYFLKAVSPFLILKREQSDLMMEILNKKSKIKNEEDFKKIAFLINRFSNLNYSKKRKKRILTP